MDWMGGSIGDVAATFIALEGWGGSECLFRLAHFIRELGIATCEEEPWGPRSLVFSFSPSPNLTCQKKGVTLVKHGTSRLSAPGDLPP